MLFINIFSHSVGCFFPFLMVSFEAQSLFFFLNYRFPSHLSLFPPSQFLLKETVYHVRFLCRILLMCPFGVVPCFSVSSIAYKLAIRIRCTFKLKMFEWSPRSDGLKAKYIKWQEPGSGMALGNAYARQMGIRRPETNKMTINRDVDKYMWEGHIMENLKDVKRNKMDLYTSPWLDLNINVL